MKNTAYFALGCFWEPDIYFSRLPGVVSTTVGYAGGKTKDPTYHNLGDHTETVKIVYNSEAISFKDLLGHFFKQHNPSGERPTQYKSAIFYTSDSQKQEAISSKLDYEHKENKEAITEIEPLDHFYKAEDYHQKYLAKNNLI